jgi:hypothetical protein
VITEDCGLKRRCKRSSKGALLMLLQVLPLLLLRTLPATARAFFSAASATLTAVTGIA